MIGDHAFLDHDRAKASDNPRAVGKNSVGTANHGHFQEQRRLDRETLGIGENGEENPACGEAKGRSQVGGTAEPGATVSPAKQDILHGPIQGIIEMQPLVNPSIFVNRST